MATTRRRNLIAAALLLVVACHGSHRDAVPLAPNKLVPFLPPAPLGWTADQLQTETPEQSKMKPPASLAGRQYRLGDRSFAVVIIDPAWKTEVYAMYMSDRQPNGARRIEAPFEKIGGWPATVHEDDMGEREVNVVVERYIVSMTSRSESAEQLRDVFQSIDDKALAALK